MRKIGKLFMALCLSLVMAMSFAACDLISAETPVTGEFSLSESAVALTFAGESKTLVAKKGTTVVHDVTWTSSDAAVANVSNGVVIALKTGTATVTATRGDESKTCAVTVTILEPEESDDELTGEFTLSSTALSFDKWDSAKVLTAKVGDTVVTDVEWITSDPVVAEVYNGVVIARANNMKGSLMGGGDGSPVPVTIQALWGEDDNEQSAACSVTVDADFSVSISGAGLDGTKLNLNAPTDTAILSAAVTLGSVGDVDDGYTWVSSNEAVATVAADGTLTAVGYGAADISAVSNLKKSMFVLISANYERTVGSAVATITVEVGTPSTDTTAIAGDYWGYFVWKGTTAALSAANVGNMKNLVAIMKIKINVDGTFTQNVYNHPRFTWVEDVDANLPETTSAELATKYGATHPGNMAANMTAADAASIVNGNAVDFHDVTKGGMSMTGQTGTCVLYGDELFLICDGQTIYVGSVDNADSNYWINNALKPFPQILAVSPAAIFTMAKGSLPIAYN
jgi:uncharacterized protein YjdB